MGDWGIPEMYIVENREKKVFVGDKCENDIQNNGAKGN